MRKLKFTVDGMTCSACQLSIEKEVKKLGVDEVRVNLMTKTMEVETKDVLSDEIIKAVSNAGYFAKIQSENNNTNKKENPFQGLINEKNDLKKKLFVSLPLMIILMYVAMGEMINIPYPTLLSDHNGSGIYAFLQFVLTIPVIFINSNYFSNGFRALINRHPNMDSLVAIGSLAAVIYGIFATFMILYAQMIGNHDMLMQYRHDIYFETAAMILSLISLGKFLEVRSKIKTTDSINKMIDLRPDNVVVIRDGIEYKIPIEKVEVGDIIKIIPAEKIAVDGKVISGTTYIDTSAITGESMPVEVNEGDNLISGSINTTGMILMKAEKVGSDTTLSKIITLMEEASSTKAKISQLADKISGVFVPVVIGISLLSFIVWLILGYGFTFAFSIAIAILVISCPCALGLATPVAVMVATGKAADHGILIKNAQALESLHETDVVLFDKTGTITIGKPVLTDIVTVNNFDSKFAIQIAKTLEKDSQHPLAHAILESERDLLALENISNFESITGKGVKAKIENKYYYIGNEKLLRDKNLVLNEIIDLSKQYSIQGKTIVYLFDENSILAFFAIADKVKDSSNDAIEKIKSLGVKTVMLTGDNKLTALEIAKQVGIDDVEAELLPIDKDSIVKRYQDNGQKVVMVGDGINDAPSLIRADVGIAIADGTDIAIDSADLVLMKSNLMDVFGAIKLSQKTIRIIKENLFWAFFYNVIAIPVAMGLFYPSLGIKLNPMIGALAMSLSSIFVVTNSLRLKSFNVEYKSNELTSNLTTKLVYDNINILGAKEENDMEKRLLVIEGMSCMHCKMGVEKNLMKVCKDVEVSLEDKTATVLVKKNTPDDDLINAVSEAGYEVVSINALK